MNNYRNLLHKVRFAILSLILTCVGFQSATAANLNTVVTKVIDSDPRNAGIDIGMSETNSELHFCVNSIQSTHSPMDVFRTFLQSAVELKGQSYTAVNLCFRGKDRFVLKGSDFQTLGEDFGTQNPAYTIRTFPGKLSGMDGQSAYPERKGGMLYLLRVQMEDFRDMHGQWYMSELLTEIIAEQDAQRPKEFASDDEVF